KRPGGADHRGRDPAPAQASTRGFHHALLAGHGRCRDRGGHGLLRRQRQDSLLPGNPYARQRAASQRYQSMNNEHALAQKICLRLDRTTEQLSPRIAERLAAAHATAMAAAKPSPRAAHSRADHPLTSDRPPLWWRVSATAVPALLLVLGVFLVDTVQQEKSVEEIAEIDS